MMKLIRLWFELKKKGMFRQAKYYPSKRRDTYY